MIKDGKICIDWEEVEEILSEDKSVLTHINFDRIIGVQRGGVILASLIHRWHPRAKLEITPPQCPIHTLREAILIVDDIWDTGATIQQISQNLLSRGSYVQYYTLTSKSKFTVPHHIFGKLINSPNWVVFPWERGDDK